MTALSRLFDVMLARDASDLHLSVGYPAMLRIRGELVPMDDHVLSDAQLLDWMMELVDDRQRSQFEETGDLDFAWAHGDKARFRANYLMKTSGAGAVFRTIPSKVLTAEQLSLPPVTLRLAERRNGLVLVTGPTGSGKSTTLAAMLDHINKTRDGHILTVEDPVEFVHQPQRCQITHREVGKDTPSFEDAIRSAGREDADVVLVGELRGAQTMRMALQIAASGVLVFATVHTNSAADTIERFVNAFPAEQQPQVRGMLGEALAGIVAQQLLRRASGKGRVAAHEVLVGSPAVASAIRERKTSLLPSLIQAGAKEGMQTMDATLLRLVVEGTVTAQDAIEKAIDKITFGNRPEIKPLLGDASL